MVQKGQARPPIVVGVLLEHDLVQLGCKTALALDMEGEEQSLLQLLLSTNELTITFKLPELLLGLLNALEEEGMVQLGGDKSVDRSLLDGGVGS